MKKGVVGVLVTDRDAHLLPRVLRSLHDSIEGAVLDYPVHLYVSLRSKDTKAKAAVAESLPRSVESVRFFLHEYDQEWADHQFHTDPILKAIGLQRQLLLDTAKLCGFSWILFLDSDIQLRPDTLSKLLHASDADSSIVVGALYQPRWSAHVVVGVTRAPEELQYGESDLQFLINPERLPPTRKAGDVGLLAVEYVGLGCCLVRREHFEASIRVGVSAGGVKGEDIGYCQELRARSIGLFVLANHVVHHIAGGTSPKLFVPNLEVFDLPIVSHIHKRQLAFIETNSKKLTWKILTPLEFAAYKKCTKLLQELDPIPSEIVKTGGDLTVLSEFKEEEAGIAKLLFQPFLLLEAMELIISV